MDSAAAKMGITESSTIHEVIQIMEKDAQERSEAAYKFGVDDGRQLGVGEGREAVKEIISQMEACVKELSEYKEELSKDVDHIITSLALHVAKNLIYKPVRTDPDVIQNVVKEALKLVEERQRISIKVHPDNWEHLKEFEPEIRKAVHGLKELEIKEDSQIEPGGCVIESDAGILDSRVETQIDELAKTLRGGE